MSFAVNLKSHTLSQSLTILVGSYDRIWNLGILLKFLNSIVSLFWDGEIEFEWHCLLYLLPFFIIWIATNALECGRLFLGKCRWFPDLRALHPCPEFVSSLASIEVRKSIGRRKLSSEKSTCSLWYKSG